MPQAMGGKPTKMALALNTLPTDFSRDGSFVDEAREAEFRSHVWKRDCQQQRGVALPAAFALLAPLLIDGPTLGWTTTPFHIDLAIRTIAGLFCLLAFLFYKDPEEKAWIFVFPFLTTLSANAVILYAAASGANDVAIATPSAIAATLVYWAFVPLRTKYLVIAGGSLCAGYLVVLAFWMPADLQTIVIAPVLLIMINVMGFFHVQTRNISERKELMISQELHATTESLKTEMETRIAAERHAGANEEIFQGVFISSPVPLCMIDFETQKVLRANTRMTALLGFNHEEWWDQPVRSLFLEESVFDEISRGLSEETAVLHDEVRLRSRDGSLKWVLLSARRFSMPDRETVLVSMVDITDQKDRANELAAANAEAQKANFAKSQFLANMSHELRTPLNAIIGFSDIMESEVFGEMKNERYAGYVSDIKGSGTHLLSIINEILDLSKIESGKAELYHEDVDLNDVVETATRLVRHHAQEKSIHLDVNLAGDELIFLADERSIKQIILNLLSNAVKFTPNGGSVTISTEQLSSHLVVQITDTGIGIPADKLETITEPFVQLQSTLTNANTGTGLGLSIASRLAELHGGTIEIKSAVNTGTTACLILPNIQDEPLIAESHTDHS